MIRNVTTFGALGLGLALTACSSNSGSTSYVAGPAPSAVPVTSSTAQPTGTFYQIELLSRPAVKEVFEPFVYHQVTNAAEPYNDPTLKAYIKTTEDALRPPSTSLGTDYGATLQSVLYPNVYLVDLTQTTGGFLGVETKGAVGGPFGGRNIDDDVVKVELAAAFGNALSTLGLIKDDGEENNCISAQNVTILASQQSSTTFPYLAQPH
ncbi:MAG: DUF4331 family protein [Candidatus Eremiobacteraeota bacterium]|nr:DUF4331 family protein [Candidatus Eremiobacteraeota bacterium]